MTRPGAKKMQAALADLRAFEVSWSGLPDVLAVYAANSAGRARYLAALSLVDCGYARSIGYALIGTRVVRAPWSDLRALCRGGEGPCPSP